MSISFLISLPGFWLKTVPIIRFGYLYIHIHGNSSNCFSFKKSSSAFVFAFLFYFFFFISVSHLIRFFLILFSPDQKRPGTPLRRKSATVASPGPLPRLRNPSPLLFHVQLSLRSSISLSGYSLLLSLSFSSFTPPLPRLYLAHSRHSRFVLRPLLPRQKFLQRDASFQFFPSLAFPLSLPLFSGPPFIPSFLLFLFLPSRSLSSLPVDK